MSYLEQARGASQKSSGFTADDLEAGKQFLSSYLRGEKSDEELISEVNKRLNPNQSENLSRYSEYRKY